MCINKDTKCMLSPSMRPIDSIVLSKLTTLHMIQSHLWIEVFVHQDSPLKQVFQMNEISQIHTSVPGRHSFGRSFLSGPTPCTISRHRGSVFLKQEKVMKSHHHGPWSQLKLPLFFLLLWRFGQFDVFLFQLEDTVDGRHPKTATWHGAKTPYFKWINWTTSSGAGFQPSTVWWEIWRLESYTISKKFARLVNGMWEL